jgi:hypothetical protein
MGITAADIAKAAEAINRHPNLSPAARRVGLELLNHIDRKTGLAWPSEARMAEALGYDERTIRRGKAELAAAGMLSWIRRGTSKRGRTPLYTLAWDSLLSIATSIKTKLKAARDAARNRARASSSSTSKSPTTSQNNRYPPPVGRTIPPAYLSQCFKISSGKGFWKAPGTPQNQILTDQQLDRKASARIWEVLGRLAPAQLAQFIDRPDAEAVQDAAIKAERYQPGTGLAVLHDLIAHEMTT